MSTPADVLIIGAGFAGLVAGRELSHRGASVLILEGRERIGGRTWTDRRLGLDLEMGGTWVHNLQPYVWAELARYGLELTPSPDADRFLIASEDGPRELTPDEGLEALARGLDLLTDGSREAMPRPFDPLFMRDEVSELDRRSVADRLATLDLDDDARVILDAFCATGFQAPPAEVGLAHAFHLTALSQWDAVTELEAAATFKIVGGTRALAEAIAADSRAAVKLGEEVVALTSDDGVVTARTAAGVEHRASAAIVTAPINALRGIEFTPALSEGKRAVVEQGQTSRGVKLWARLRGRTPPFLAFASPADSPLTIAQYEYAVDDDSVIVAFGDDATRITPDDRDGAQAALRRWLPDAEVVDVAGHDWTADPLSRETWANLRPGQLTGAVPELQRPEGPIHLAGSDYATGWLGYIDGAVESAIVTSRRVLAALGR
jgi:monoamine oxidase